MRSIAAALVIALTTGGCSWIGMTRAPESPVPGKRVRCTRSRVPQVIDFLIAGIATSVIAVRSFRDCEKRVNQDDCGLRKGLEIGVLGAAGATATASGITGLYWREDCEQARAASVMTSTSAMPDSR